MSASPERPAARAALAATLAAALAAPAAAQVADVCPPAEPACANAVLSALDARARAVLVASGGSPVPGSASTLGRRTARSRRATVAVRTTFGRAGALRSEPDRHGTLAAVGVDGAIALFDGFFVAPTVGGVLSLDALASAGWVGGGDPPRLDGSFTWALGARVGVLRESFTLPGLSLSVMYRGMPSLAAGDTASGPAWTAESDALSVRGTLGKRIGGADAFAGVAWDRAGGSLEATYLDGSAVRESAGVRDLSEGRWAGFGGLGYTFLVFQLAVEAGWQAGGGRHAGQAFAIDASDGRFFGGLSFRFTY